MPLKINVPYKEKEEAKSKGACWDTENKTWYVPENKDYNDFIKWIDTEKITIIAKKPFYLAVNKRNCWKCAGSTKVVALSSNHFYEFDYVDDDDLNQEWVERDYFTFFSMPDNIEKEIIELIQKKYPFYKYGYSKTVEGKYIANHCQNCNALQGDFFNHNEPGGAFSPISIEECQEITLIEVPSKYDLMLNAGTGLSSIEDLIVEHSKRDKW